MNTNQTPFDVTHDVFCVLYADSTGEIHFVHRVITLGDAQPPSADEIQADAHRNMQESVVRYHRTPPAKLSALLVPPDKFERGRSYHVHCESKTLRELPKALRASDEST